VSLNDSYDIASSAITTFAESMKVNTQNMANAQTPGYRRKIPVIQEQNGVSFETLLNNLHRENIGSFFSVPGRGVQMITATEDGQGGAKIYMPGHPQADKQGFIRMSNVNPLIEMSDATTTQRVYEANIAVVGLIQDMLNRALRIGQGG
jgi:flagellar basal-body rod protein FlgC